MPIGNFAQAQKFAAMCGAKIPDWLARQFDGLEEKHEERGKVSVAAASELCRKLLDGGVENLHFYTLNRADLVQAVCGDL